MTLSDDRPERMMRRGRPVDSDFAPEELLYRRCTLDEVENDRLAPTAIHFRDYSVNRGKHSEPEDVLIPDYDDSKDYTGWGVASFKVEDIPPSMRTEGTTRFEFRVVHVPREENYSHSEIQTFKNGIHAKRIKLSQTNKLKQKALREQLSRKTKIVHYPRAYSF